MHPVVGGVGSGKKPTLTCPHLLAVFDLLGMNEQMGSQSGDIMENTITGDADVSQPLGERSAVQNASTSTRTLKLVLLWLVVGLPLVWGVMKALEDVGNIFP
jgi:hypothetical protein